MSTQPKTLLTPEEYLEIERKAEVKSEYCQGEMFAMAGAAWPHNVIVGNLIIELGQQLRSRPCTICPSDMRVRVNPTSLYTYPDVQVVCGEPQFLDHRRDTLLNPTLIIEVLSHSTEAYDRGRKFDHYRSIESLRAYLMVSSDRIHADLFTREPGGQWLLGAADRVEDALEIESIGCRLTLAGVYHKTELLNPLPPTAG